MTRKSPDPVFVLRADHHPIHSIDFIKPKSCDESIRHLASGNQEGQVFIWDLKVRGVQMKWRAQTSSILWLKYLNSSNFWTSGRGDSATLWDLSEGSAKEKTRIFLDNYLGFSKCDVVTFEDRNLLCVPGSSQNSFTLWDVDSRKKICCLTPREANTWGSIMQCKWVELNKSLHVLVSYENGTLALWDWPNNKILSSLSCNDTPICLEFDANLLRGVIGTASEKTVVFGIDEATRQIHFEREFNITNPGIGCAAGRADGKIYAVGGWDHRIRLFSWRRHKPLAVLMYHKKSIECIAFSKAPVHTLSDGYLLAAGSSDNSISLWDIYN